MNNANTPNARNAPNTQNALNIPRAFILLGLLAGAGWLASAWYDEPAQAQTQSRVRRVSSANSTATPTPTPTPLQADVTAPPANDDEEIVRVETTVTNVLLTALDADQRFVTTLTPNDVRVYENDTQQQIFTFQKETDLPISVALVLDISVSQENTLPEEKAAAAEFIQNTLRPDRDRATIVPFSGVAETRQPLTNDIGELRQALDRVEISRPPVEYQQDDAEDPGCRADPRGCSAIWDALWATTRQVLATTPENTRRAIILLSDGQDSSSEVKREAAAEEAVKNNTVIYAIGIGDPNNYKIEESSLRKLAERTGGRAFFPRRGQDARSAFAQIEAELRAQYLLAYNPLNRARDGSYRRIRIELANPDLRKRKLRLFYRAGYYARRS